MKTILWLLLFLTVVTSSCNPFNDFGKKIEYGKSEVYYKGDGVTEKDAQRLGDYLLEEGYLDKKEARSVQLTHDGEDYIIRLAYDKNSVDEKRRNILWKFQYNISKSVFKNKPVRIALANEQLEDFEILNPITLHEIDKSIIFYDNSEISKSDIKKLEKLLREQKLAGDDKESAVFVTKENKIPIIRMVVDNPSTIKGDVLAAFGYWQALMQDDVFDNSKARLLLISTDLQMQKSVPKISAEKREAFDKEINQTEETVDNTLVSDTSSSGVLRLPND